MKQDNFTSQKRASGSGRAVAGLPTTANGRATGGRSAMTRGRQIHKTFDNIKITILYGFVTILVLKGTIGIGFLIS